MSKTRRIISNAFLLAVLLTAIIVIFVLKKPDPLAISGSGGYGYSKVNLGCIDTLGWIDLSTYGYPQNLFWQLDLMSASNATCTLLVWVEGSNNIGYTDRNAWKCRLGHFFDGNDWKDSIFVHADTNQTYFLTMPIEGVVDMTTGADTVYQYIRPITAIPKFVRIWMQTSTSLTPLTATSSATWTKRLTLQYLN